MFQQFEVNVDNCITVKDPRALEILVFIAFAMEETRNNTFVSA